MHINNKQQKNRMKHAETVFLESSVLKCSELLIQHCQYRAILPSVNSRFACGPPYFSHGGGPDLCFQTKLVVAREALLASTLDLMWINTESRDVFCLSIALPGRC